MKIAFLDRDGVINKDNGYVGKIADFVWCDGVFKALLQLQEKGFCVIIVTNQSGIAREFYSQSDFDELTKWMLGELHKHGIKVLKVYFCPHAKEENCQCRKPRPGMILQALKDFDVDIKNSILVGDKQSDIDAANAAGITKTFLLSPNDESAQLRTLSDVIKNI